MAGKIASLISQNKEIYKRISQDFGISQLKVPNQLASKIVPVLISNPERVATIVKTGFNGTLYTPPANADFYITAAWISSNAQSAGRIEAIVGGVAVRILEVNASGVANLSLTPTISFIPPIKVDRNTSISVVGTGFDTNGCIIGYLVESSF